MRVNFGLYVSAVVVCDLVLVWLSQSHAGQSRVCRGSVLAAGALFTAPLLLSNAIFYACLYGRDTSAVLAQTVLAPQKLVGAHRFVVLDVSAGTACSLAFPMLWFAIRLLAGADRRSGKWLLPAVLGCALAATAFVIRRQPAIALYIPALEIALIAAVYALVLRLSRSEMCLLLLYSFLLHYYLSRADDWHMAPLQLIGAMLVPYLLFSPAGTRPSTKVRRHGERIRRDRCRRLRLAIGRRPATPRQGFQDRHRPPRQRIPQPECLRWRTHSVRRAGGALGFAVRSLRRNARLTVRPRENLSGGSHLRGRRGSFEVVLERRARLLAGR
jgi:hypothetical protein